MIEIRERLRPFSHLPGIACLIPGTSYVVQAFPAYFKINELATGKLLKEQPLLVDGPLKEFTLMQDLERGRVTLFSEKYSYQILPTLEIIDKKEARGLPTLPLERLSFGMHKKQEWELIKRRLDLREIFPIWFRLGSLLPQIPFLEKDEGMFSLLYEIKKILAARQPEKIVPSFTKLFLAGFYGLMVPRLEDSDFQGILRTGAISSEASPLLLLQQGAELIRSLFIKSEENKISLLPNLPPEFFSGCFMHLNCQPYGIADMEWTKKTLRRVVFRASTDGVVHFQFQSFLKSFRLRNTKKDRGFYFKCGEPLEIKSGNVYLLDQFQK